MAFLLYDTNHDRTSSLGRMRCRSRQLPKSIVRINLSSQLPRSMSPKVVSNVDFYWTRQGEGSQSIVPGGRGISSDCIRSFFSFLELVLSLCISKRVMEYQTVLVFIFVLLLARLSKPCCRRCTGTFVFLQHIKSQFVVYAATILRRPYFNFLGEKA